MEKRLDLIQKWDSEYAEGGLPSSARQDPSGAVVWALAELERLSYPLHDAVDVGCGKGRNSLYMAAHGLHVTALDFTPNAVRALDVAAKAQGLEALIRSHVHDVTEPWPMEAFSADLVVDTFCFKHIAPHEARVVYKENLLRVLRGRAHYLISFASIGDGYYGRYVRAQNRVDGEVEHLVLDPVNGIESVLFTRKGVVKFFAPELSIFAEIHNNQPVMRHGEVTVRDTYALLLGRNPHVI